MRKWLTRCWWSYLFEGCRGWTNFWCRARGHPGGVWWHNAYGDGPDMRCQNCGEDLG